MAVPLIGGLATGTAARTGGTALVQSARSGATGLMTRVRGFFATPGGAATGGFFAGDFLGSFLDGSASPIGDLGESVGSLVSPGGILLVAVLVIGAYLVLKGDVVAIGGNDGGGKPNGGGQS